MQFIQDLQKHANPCDCDLKIRDRNWSMFDAARRTCSNEVLCRTWPRREPQPLERNGFLGGGGGGFKYL